MQHIYYFTDIILYCLYVLHIAHNVFNFRSIFLSKKFIMSTYQSSIHTFILCFLKTVCNFIILTHHNLLNLFTICFHVFFYHTKKFQWIDLYIYISLGSYNIWRMTPLKWNFLAKENIPFAFWHMLPKQTTILDWAKLILMVSHASDSAFSVLE